MNKGYADGQGIPLVVKEKPEPLWVLGDWNRLTQVLTNLISNAVKFSNSPTPVEFEVRPQGAERVRVTVSDHGGGIPAEFHARVFEKFSQADSSNTRSKGGTGLGLSISESIIEAHQGTIAFVSRPGEGTSFYFDLPRHEPSQTNAPGTAAALKPTGPG